MTWTPEQLERATKTNLVFPLEDYKGDKVGEIRVGEGGVIVGEIDLTSFVYSFERATERGRVKSFTLLPNITLKEREE